MVTLVNTICSIFANFRVNVGLFCSTPAVAVGRSVPKKVAMEMLFTGEPITAQGTFLELTILRFSFEYSDHVPFFNLCTVYEPFRKLS